MKELTGYEGPDHAEIRDMRDVLNMGRLKVVESELDLCKKSDTECRLTIGQFQGKPFIPEREESRRRSDFEQTTEEKLTDKEEELGDCHKKLDHCFNFMRAAEHSFNEIKEAHWTEVDKLHGNQGALEYRDLERKEREL